MFFVLYLMYLVLQFIRTFRFFYKKIRNAEPTFHVLSFHWNFSIFRRTELFGLRSFYFSKIIFLIFFVHQLKYSVLQFIRTGRFFYKKIKNAETTFYVLSSHWNFSIFPKSRPKSQKGFYFSKITFVMFFVIYLMYLVLQFIRTFRFFYKKIKNAETLFTC